MNGRFVSYLRVSTDRQGRSGLGIEAQREAVARHLNGGSWSLLAEYTEVESGKSNERPELAKALAHARMTNGTLIVAKLDRLSRDAGFLMSVWSGSGEGGVLFCDLPQLPAGPVGKFLVQQMAAVAELERGLISQRTKDALTAAKARAEARGEKLKLGGHRGFTPAAELGGEANRKAASAFAEMVGPHVAALRAQGLTLRQIAAKLAEDGIRTPRGGAWTATGVKNVLDRLAA